MRMAGDVAKRTEFGGGAITGDMGSRRTAENVQIGSTHDAGAKMPQDLAAGYLNLAVPGSPLGGMGLLAANNLRNSQITQDAIQASQTQQLQQMQAMRGMLPVGTMQQQRRG
jgi:hypothetical protein